MADKTIKDRGLSTVTLTAPWGFGFDKATRQLEMVCYFQYCVANGLITVSGEQARTSLIRKTFNHKGGTGIIWNLAMADWLKDIIPSAQNDLYKLWLAYFTKYAVTPDPEGVTYAGLSVEAGYRKFLQQHIGGSTSFAPAFTDQILLTELVRFRLKKFFSDSVTLNEAVQIVLKAKRTFSDTVTMSDTGTVVFAQKKFFSDTVTLADAFLAKLAKGFNDSVTLSDVTYFVKLIKRTFNDSVTLSESLKFAYVPRFSDTVTLADALKLIYKQTFADTVTLNDSLNKLIYKPYFNDVIVLEETLLYKSKKFFNDSVTLADSASFNQQGGYGSGGYGEGGYGA